MKAVHFSPGKGNLPSSPRLRRSSAAGPDDFGHAALDEAKSTFKPVFFLLSLLLFLLHGYIALECLAHQDPRGLMNIPLVGMEATVTGITGYLM